jgi:hypothetical protein
MDTMQSKWVLVVTSLCSLYRNLSAHDKGRERRVGTLGFYILEKEIYIFFGW